MALNDIAPHGPFTCEYTFHFTDGEFNAEVKFDAPRGHIATPADIAILAQKAKDAMEGQGSGFRMMTRDEFVSDQINQHAGTSGIRFATPKGGFSEDWAK